MSDGDVFPCGFVCKDGVFLCPFFHVWRVHWGVRFCDNLVKGVPACVVAGFYPIVDPFSVSPYEHWSEDGVKVGVWICLHFCRSDLSEPKFKSVCCFTRRTCIHSDVAGFGACVGCCRFVR